MTEREWRSVLTAFRGLTVGEFEKRLRNQDWLERMASLLLDFERSSFSSAGLTKEEICELRDFYYICASRLNAPSTSNQIASHSPSPAIRPPFNAEYLLILFLGKEERDIVIGDLVECYYRVVRQFGKRRADFWFYKQVVGSLWPLLRHALLRIGALVWLGRILRRLIS